MTSGSLFQAAALIALVVTACAAEPAPARRTTGVEPKPAASPPAPPARLALEVLATYPHAPEAFTQGLLVHDGALYESTGRYGRSSLRRIDPETGRVLAERSLSPNLFGEGLARVGDRLVQLTWREGVAPVWDLSTLEPLDQLSYQGEGWGLTFDGERLVMSDGSSTLTFRDPETFEVQGTVPVTADGDPVERLNELECVDGHVWANIYPTDLIVEIDPGSGEVVSSVDAAGLLPPGEANAADVLNGIAYDPTNEQFLITGKLWPTLFVVRFVP